MHQPLAPHEHRRFGVAPESVGGEAPTGVLPAEGRPHVNGDGPAVEPIEPFWMARGGRLLHRAGCGWEGRVPSAERLPVAPRRAADGVDRS